MTLESLLPYLEGGAIVGLVTLAREYLRYRAEQERRRVPIVLEAVSRVYSLMNGLLKDTPAEKIVLVKVENGGRVPMVGSQLTGSVVYEVYDGIDPSIRSWRQRDLDMHYVQLMRDVYERRRVVQIREEMPRCTLRDHYEAIGVAQSDVHYVHATDGAFYALSITFDRVLAFDARYEDLVRSAVTEIQQIFERQSTSLTERRRDP